ncbi:hypothetical protein SK128_002568 [Halocaridina rubra]|uniref:Uncharacterized protein n=1 Tax=Halocaridina rubra TaxID=373956 RepID=A0AAN8WLW7_HALRR
MPDINLLPSCAPDPPITTVAPKPSGPLTPKPLNLSLCICARVLIPPLQALEAALAEVNIKIQNTMTELWECRFREDALERARELAQALEELVIEMNAIVAQIDSYTETRSGRANAKWIVSLQRGITSMESKLTRQSGVIIDCDDRGQLPVDQVKALQWSIKLFLASPTNQDIQHSLNCWTYLVTTLMFKILNKKATLADAEILTVKEIFMEITSHLLMVDKTVEYLFEWNNAREETLQRQLDDLQTRVDEIVQQIPQST